MGCNDPEHTIWSLGPAEPEAVSFLDILNIEANTVFYCLGQFGLLSVPDLYTTRDESVLCVHACMRARVYTCMHVCKSEVDVGRVPQLHTNLKKFF